MAAFYLLKNFPPNRGTVKFLPHRHPIASEAHGIQAEVTEPQIIIDAIQRRISHDELLFHRAPF